MKYKNIVTLAIISLISCIAIRTAQILFVIEDSTGFIKKEYESMGFIMTVLILMGAIFAAGIAFTVRRIPKTSPKINIWIGFSSIALGGAILFDVINVYFSSRVPLWQIVFTDVFGIAAIIFFMAYGLTVFFGFSIPPIFFSIPVLYGIFKLISIFTTISSIALVSDNLFSIFSNCATLIFMLEIGKFKNNIKTKNINKKILASGFCAIILNVVVMIPPVIAMIAGKILVYRAGGPDAILSLFTALFIAAYTFSTFKKKSSPAKTHERKYVINNDHNNDNFYFDTKKDNPIK